MHIHLATLHAQPDVDPAAFAVLHGPLNNTALPVFAPLVLPEVVRRVQRIHQAREAQGRVPRKQRLAQVLRCFQILEILDEKLGGCQILHHALHLLRLIVTDNDDLIDAEDGGGLGDLADQVRLQLHRLRVVDDRGGHHDRHREVSEGVFVHASV